MVTNHILSELSLIFLGDHQGAGKTTVIAPLLALMMADGESLVMSVVPKALLEMSRNVMRSTFSSIVEKRIYTLVFDRGSDVPPALFDKLEGARRESGVVVRTSAHFIHSVHGARLHTY